jgi:DNA-binding LacI/PurR family transcriptional regulator
MQEAGLTPHVIQMRRDLEPADRLVAVRELLQQDDRPTAMAGYGGEIDVACTAAMSLGLSVPDDLDLVRFSENMVTFGGVTLPTLRIPQKQLAKAAAAALRAKINQPAVQLDPVAVPFCDRIPIVSQLPPQPAPPRRVPVPKG